MPRSKELSELEKWEVVAAYNLALGPNRVKLGKGELNKLENRLGISGRTISKIAHDYSKQMIEKGPGGIDLSPKKIGNVGRKSTMTAVEKRKLHRKNTVTKGTGSLRMLASETNISLSRVFRHMKKNFVTSQTKWIKPKLSDKHKFNRINFILKLKDPRKTWKFKEQKNVIVIDESWFYLYKNQSLVRVFPGDEIPSSDKVQHKSHIPKLMFLTALARPDPEHHFDGKIGIWRVQKEKICTKTNRFHRRGDVYFKDSTMDGELYKDFMQKIFAAVKQKMPWLKGKEVIVQQDGAPAHTTTENLRHFDQEGKKDGWKIKVITQPAQSPDLNINDLAFFRSLKCRVERLKNSRQTLDSLYNSVELAWIQYDSDTLQRIWGVQYACYREILRRKGDNDYKTPHTGVRKRLGEIDFKIIENEYLEAENFSRNNRHVWEA